RTTRALARRVTALEDEARDDAVEHDPVEVVVPSQENEAVHGLRRGERVEVEDHRPVRRVHRRYVPLVRVDDHRRLLVERALLCAGAVWVGGRWGGHGRIPSALSGLGVAYDELIVTLSMRCVTSGGMPLVDPSLLMVLTTSIPEVTWPKSE